MDAASNVVFWVLIFATLVIHLGDYVLRQDKNWIAKMLLSLGFIVVITMSAQYYINIAHLESFKSRHVSDAQKSGLLATLKTKPVGRIGFKSKFSDAESFNYAVALRDVFKSAGWDVEEAIDRTSTNDLFGFVTIRVTQPNLLDLAIFVCETLKDKGIDCRPVDIKTGTFTGGMKENSIYIFVGQQRK